MHASPEAVHSKVKSGQTQLAVSTWGAGGTPLVALHAGVADSRSWQWCAPAWTQAGYQVAAYDRRGFGATTAPAEDHDVVVDLLAVMDAQVDGPAVVIGNSMGGGLALDLAMQHPERVQSLVLIAPSPSGYPYEFEWVESEAEQAQDALIAAADEAGDIELVNRLEARYWLDGTEQPEGRVEGEARELFLDMNGVALAAGDTGTAADRPPVWPRLGELQVPTLVIGGVFDLPGMTQLCRSLAAAVPDATLTLLDGSAHCPSLDQPDALASLVLDFLA